MPPLRPLLCLSALLLPGGAGAMSGSATPAVPPLTTPAPVLTLTPPPPIVTSGVLTRDVIRRVIYVHINEIRHCYQQELQMRPALAGRIIVSFLITDRGQVRDLAVRKTTLNLPSLLLCLTETMRRWEFPATYSQSATHVIYPFVLRPWPKEQAPVGVQITDEELARLGIHKETEAPEVDILFQ